MGNSAQMPAMSDSASSSSRSERSRSASPGRHLKHEPMPERFLPRQAGATGQSRLRILAFGDSLTAGFCNRGRRFTPYAPALVEALAPDIEAEVWTCGLSGLTVKELVQKLPAKSIRDRGGRIGKGIQKILSESGPFHLALIMAGTNDLPAVVMRGQVADLVNNVKALHHACHEFNVATVVLSVPPNRMYHESRHAEGVSKNRRKYVECWQQTNQALEAWAQELSGGAGVALYVDTEQAVPFSEESGCWEDDGLHFSPEGSEQLGTILAQQLAPLLRKILVGGKMCPECRYSAPRRGVPMPERISPPPSDGGGKRRRVLAYGDSLTAGYHAFGSLFRPYAESFVTTLSPRVAVEAWVCGLSGMTAEEMAQNLDAESLQDCAERNGKGIRRILSEHGPFDLALIMAGTNDLGDDIEPDAIAGSLQAMHKACHEAGVETVALSVPTSKFAELDIEAEGARRKVNKAMRAWASSAAEGDAQGSLAGVVCCIDTVDLLPYSKDNGRWDADGLHFSWAGSEHFGVRLAEHLSEHLLRDRACSGREEEDAITDSAQEIAADGAERGNSASSPVLAEESPADAET